ncbi:MAG TPA: glycosyltransferase [Anaerolineales bacterium]|nr:glycosyltransferase [Anaerolineales bacterium]
MRIAYVSLHWPRLRAGSVGRKIQRTLNAWRAAGHEARFFMHTSGYAPAEALLPAEISTFHAANRLGLELSRMKAAQRLVGAVGTYQPDLIYLRYGMYVYPIHRLAGIAPVIEDVTTNDLIQHKELGWIYSLYNRLTRGILLRRVSGLVAISRELADSPIFAQYHKPTIVIANGIDLANYAPLPAPANARPRLVYMGTPTAGFAAHGIDKLVTLAELCPDLHIDVIGYDGIRARRALPLNIVFHGYLSMERYIPLLAGSDVAVSSLAFHRVGMQEQSPLKSREYLAYGLPMVVPYKDTDLDDLDCDFLLKIPNREDNIRTHAGVIREFAYRMRGRRAERARFAARIDVGPKERKRLEFFQQLLGASTARA